MWIIEFTDYKTFLKALIKTFPKGGRGQVAKLAAHLRVSPMVMSHILTRERHLSPDQSLQVAKFFGLDEKASEYFMYLVSHARCDTKDLKDFYESKLTQIRSEVQNIKNLVAGSSELSEADKGVFYSDWYYCGVSLLTSIKGHQTVDSIASYFGLTRSKVGDIVSFLVSTGLCVESEGHIRMGTKSTHVDDKSRFVNSHRRNWREKARERFTQPKADDLFYSSPVSLSKDDSEKFRKELLNLIKNFSKQVATSPEQKLMCLNIDWFNF